MDDIEIIRETTFKLYKQLIGKVVSKLPLTERERTAYFALDFRTRLAMGAHDGIVQNPQPFVDSLVRLGLMAHAKKLKHAVRLGPSRLDGDTHARETCEHELGAMTRAHFDGDDSVFDRAVFAFWQGVQDSP